MTVPPDIKSFDIVGFLDTLILSETTSFVNFTNTVI
jgi:hypothetical protein